ncbi:hypothetical protein POM88_049385 [Heracleum sosnowskyi]|uniref:Uncharacterized protein n=1 Tax=Heracleum sosnowskyi TaxID=360622 RepID=A0AAD8GXR0_9APIA|nr:hypothetical protein POM88_049385 [Heracleum sosnowskyi]
MISKFRKQWSSAPAETYLLTTSSYSLIPFPSRAKHAVVSGASRRVRTTYAQLIAALAAAQQLGEDHISASNFTFFSSFHSNLLTDGLRHQVGWGHAWNRFAGPLSCDNQPNQCSLTPLLPLAWWDGISASWHFALDSWNLEHCYEPVGRSCCQKTFLLEGCRNDSKSKEIANNNNFVKQVFGGHLVSKLKCCNRDHLSNTYEPSIDLSLDIKDVTTLQAALKSFTNLAKIEDPDTKSSLTLGAVKTVMMN